MMHGLLPEAELRAKSAAVAQQYGTTVGFAGADLRQPQQIRDMVRQVQEQHGKLDILVNNAGGWVEDVRGGWGGRGVRGARGAGHTEQGNLCVHAGIQFVAPVHEFPEDKWDAIIDVLLNAPFHATKAALPGMLEAGWGRVVNTGGRARRCGAAGATTAQRGDTRAHAARGSSAPRPSPPAASNQGPCTHWWPPPSRAPTMQPSMGLRGSPRRSRWRCASAPPAPPHTRTHPRAPVFSPADALRSSRAGGHQGCDLQRRVPWLCDDRAHRAPAGEPGQDPRHFQGTRLAGGGMGVSLRGQRVRCHPPRYAPHPLHACMRAGQGHHRRAAGGPAHQAICQAGGGVWGGVGVNRRRGKRRPRDAACLARMPIRSRARPPMHPPPPPPPPPPPSTDRWALWCATSAPTTRQPSRARACRSTAAGPRAEAEGRGGGAQHPPLLV